MKARGIKGVPYGRPCPSPEGGLEVEGKRRSGAPRGAPVRVTDRQFPPAGGTGSIARSATGCGVPHQRLSALRSLTFGEGDLPSSAEGMEMPGAPRALREQGRRSFGTFLAGCLTCESDVRAHEKRERVLAERTRGLPARSRDRIPRRRSSPAALGFIPPSGSACTPAAALTSRAASARPTASAPPVFW